MFRSRRRQVLILALTATPLLSIAALRAQVGSPVLQIEQKIDAVMEMLDTVVRPRSQSVTLSTSLVLVSLQGQTVACTVVNVSSQPITVTAAVMDLLGSVRNSSDFVLPPGEGFATFGGAQHTPDLLRCQIRFDGRPTDIRAALGVHTDMESPITVVSVPAQ